MLFMNKSPSAWPVPKVVAGGGAAAATALLVWALDAFLGIRMPAEAAAGLTAFISFGAAYLTPPGGVR